MNDFLRSMRGDAGPRIARATIKRLRNLWTVVAVSSLTVCAAIGYLIGPSVARAHPGLLVAALVPLTAGALAQKGCETQIRHLNDLALSPYESGRMDLGAVSRMWLGNGVMIFAGVFFVVCAVLSRDGGPDQRLIALVAASVLLLGGYVLARYKTGLAWASSRYLYYDPDEDAWTYGFGQFWWR